MENKRLLMLSLDAVSTNDLVTLSQLPNFKRLLSHGTLVKNVSSVFVSNTYPAHTSIITGVYPKDHGIYDNIKFSPNKDSQQWMFDSAKIKVPTLYQKLKEYGGTICSILYPVAGGADIDYNLPEIAGTMSILKRVSTMFKYGSPRFLISSVVKFGRYFKGISQPSLDDFTTKIAVDNLVRKKPNLLMLHLIDTDETKHIYGPNSKEATASLYRQDKRIGLLLNALETAGTIENTGIIIFSDHGCLAVKQAVNPNDYLKENGYNQQESDAFFHCSGGTAFLKIANLGKATAITAFFEGFLKESFVERQLTQSEMIESGMATYFDFGVAAKEGYCFGEEHLGQHGYTLDRPNYQPFYLAVGKGIGSGEVLTGGCIIDICPLAADILEIPLWKMEGINRISYPTGGSI